jgi:hypothetical protein
VLADGDTVTVIKSLKVKGSPHRHQGGHQGPKHPPRQRHRQESLTDWQIAQGSRSGPLRIRNGPFGIHTLPCRLGAIPRP